MEANIIKSVDKAMQLLEVVSRYSDGIAITELSHQVGMNKSTVHHLLATLMRRGFVQQDETTSYYKLGYSLLDLGMRLLMSLDLRREAYPILKTLAEKSGEVAHLAVLERNEVIYIEKVDGKNTVRLYSRVGKRVPVHATGLGKAILAYLPHENVLDILDQYGLPYVTPQTVTDRTKFLTMLQQVRNQGFATDREENEPGICCIAAPVWNHLHQVVAACSVLAPCERMDAEKTQALIVHVTLAARLISERLGDSYDSESDVQQNYGFQSR